MSGACTSPNDPGFADRATASMRRLCEVDVADLIVSLHLLDWKGGGDPETFAMIEHWPPAMPVNSVFETVQKEYPDRHRGMTCFSRMIPGQFIEPHQDNHDGHCKVRIHVPLITNPGVAFVSGKQAFHMAVGWVWEIDPSLVHCVANSGETDRVHLFFNMRDSR